MFFNQFRRHIKSACTRDGGFEVPGGTFHEIGKTKLKKELLTKEEFTEEEQNEWEKYPEIWFENVDRNET